MLHPEACHFEDLLQHACVQAKPKKEKPSEYYAGIVTPSSRSEARYDPVVRIEAISERIG